MNGDLVIFLRGLANLFIGVTLSFSFFYLMQESHKKQKDYKWIIILASLLLAGLLYIAVGIFGIKVLM